MDDFLRHTDVQCMFWMGSKYFISYCVQLGARERKGKMPSLAIDMCLGNRKKPKPSRPNLPLSNLGITGIAFCDSVGVMANFGYELDT